MSTEQPDGRGNGSWAGWWGRAPFRSYREAAEVKEGVLLSFRALGPGALRPEPAFRRWVELRFVFFSMRTCHSCSWAPLLRPRSTQCWGSGSFWPASRPPEACLAPGPHAAAGSGPHAPGCQTLVPLVKGLESGREELFGSLPGLCGQYWAQILLSLKEEGALPSAPGQKPQLRIHVIGDQGSWALSACQEGVTLSNPQPSQAAGNNSCVPGQAWSPTSDCRTGRSPWSPAELRNPGGFL